LFNVLQDVIDKVDVKVKTDDLYFIISAENVSVHYSIHQPSGQPPYIHLNLKITGILEEAKHRLSENKMDLYGQAASKDIKERVEALLEKFQQANVDPMGFGLLYRAIHFTNESELKDWQEMYANLKFDVHVETEMKGIGLVN